MEQTAEELLRETGALLNGHFQLTSGRHSSAYIEKFRILEQPRQAEWLCQLIADRFRDAGVELVAGPTTGGIILSYEIARQLGVRAIFAEKSATGRQFERGFKVSPGERTLVVDDILTTGNSINDVLTALQEVGGNPIGIGVLVDRTGGSSKFSAPLYACHTLTLSTYDPAKCPLCENGELLTLT